MYPVEVTVAVEMFAHILGSQTALGTAIAPAF
jgi:hypothetical protein